MKYSFTEKEVIDIQKLAEWASFGECNCGYVDIAAMKYAKKVLRIIEKKRVIIIK